MKKIIAVLIVVLICGCTSAPQQTAPVLEGPFLVTNVVDGDTLDLNNSERVRLSGINTPETGECFYQEAKDALSFLTLGKEVYLEQDTTDQGKYGRLLRYIYADSQLVNSALVYNGYARVYDKYKEDTKKYEELKEFEQNAVEKNLGVWNCTDPKAGCLYVRSSNSEIYHSPECKWAKKIKPENLVCYTEEWEIENLTPAKSC